MTTYSILFWEEGMESNQLVACGMTLDSANRHIVKYAIGYARHPATKIVGYVLHYGGLSRAIHATKKITGEFWRVEDSEMWSDEQ